MTPSRSRRSSSFLTLAKENALNFFVPMRRYSARERILERADRFASCAVANFRAPDSNEIN